MPEVDPRDRELLIGMGNCFAACGADFEGTLEMVSGARGRTIEEVRDTLRRMRAQYGADPEFQALRARLPDTFPV